MLPTVKPDERAVDLERGRLCQILLSHLYTADLAQITESASDQRKKKIGTQWFSKGVCCTFESPAELFRNPNSQVAPHRPSITMFRCKFLKILRWFQLRCSKVWESLN